MICYLCLLEKEPKSNTHYLSDFIIKSALNEDGVNTRGKGIYWGIDSHKLTVDFKFQQQASPKTLEDLLGRKTTEIENKNAEQSIDFTVSNSFCKECEDIFTKIETEFVNKIIAKFRNSNLDNINEKTLNQKESQITRLFFLLQFWRTSHCDSSIKLSATLQERLRRKVLVADNTGLDDIPLSVTYLETTKDPEDSDTGNKYKTHNIVSIIDGSNPSAIIMNDFVIQLYEDLNFPFNPFYGFNNIADYITYLNYNQNLFKIKILPNDRRKAIVKSYFTLAAKGFLQNHLSFFYENYTSQFRRLPTNIQIEHYFGEITKDNNIMKFSSEELTKNILKYFETFYK